MLFIYVQNLVAHKKKHVIQNTQLSTTISTLAFVHLGSSYFCGTFPQLTYLILEIPWIFLRWDILVCRVFRTT